jgi:cytidylate kinase
VDIKQTKHELQNIISGKSSNSHDAFIQTVAHYLRSGKRTSAVAEAKHQNKEKEKEKLIDFAQENNLFIKELNENKFISSGAEQKVYIKNNSSVLCFIDTVFYIDPKVFWLEY